MNPRKKTTSALCLWELLVVLGIIALLLYVVLPRISRSARHSSFSRVKESFVKQLVSQPAGPVQFTLLMPLAADAYLGYTGTEPPDAKDLLFIKLGSHKVPEHPVFSPVACTYTGAILPDCISYEDVYGRAYLTITFPPAVMVTFTTTPPTPQPIIQSSQPAEKEKEQ